MALLKEESYTIEDIYALPDGERAELIDGHIYYMAPPSYKHCDPNKLDDKGCKGAPDWIIEIVSPASRKMDYLLKLFKYRSAGVREYWIVDIAKNRITVYNFNHDYSIEEYSFTDTVKAGIYEDLSIDFSEINIL